MDFIIKLNKKDTGLGISEFMLRFMAWLCLKGNSLSGSEMCIVTGPTIDLAIALIDTMSIILITSIHILPLLLYLWV